MESIHTCTSTVPTETTDIPAISMQGVTFRFQEKGKRNILDHVSLSIPDGQTTVIMGSSGCGKSTLAAVAAGLYPENGGFLTEGEIFLYGKPLKGMDPQTRSRELSLLFQNPDLQFCMDTPRKELCFCMENACIPAEEMEEQVQYIAVQMGIEPLLDQKLFSLSGGEKQRVSLACLLAVGSRCIILDEAFANLDHSSGQEMIAKLKELKQQGKTIIAIDHQLDLWQELADEILVLGEGGHILCRSHGVTEELQRICEQEGLFYPGDPISIASEDRSVENAIAFDHVTIPREVHKTRLGRSVFGESLLEDTSAQFPKGKLTAVLGPSGCGKTTTFLSVMKKHPYLGTIRVNGVDIQSLKPAALYKEIGIVFQNPANQFVTQKVSDEVSESLKLWKKEHGEETVLAALDAYGLKRLHRYSPYMLSQGQQRRLAVLSVLSGGQKILLLDEPTYGQDYRSTKAIMEQLREKTDAEGLTVIFITHDRKLARKWADRIYVLQDKKLIETEGADL